MRSVVHLKLSAVEDLAEGFAWYEASAPGLGDEFLAAVATFTSNRLPGIYDRMPWAYKNVRRALVQRFPYSVFYGVA